MMELESVDIDRIHIRSRHRVVNEARVKLLADSMSAIGLQSPITIYVAEKAILDGEEIWGVQFVVAGASRLRAAKLLEWKEIDCFTTTLDELDRERWEIEENLTRAELTKIERAQHNKRLIEIIKQRQIINSENQSKPTPGKPSDGTTVAVVETANATGQSEAEIWQDKSRAADIDAAAQDSLTDPEAPDAIKATADSGVDLDALKKLSAEEQNQALNRVATGASKNIREAAEFIRGEEPDELEKQTEKGFQSIRRAWNRNSDQAQLRFLEWIDAQVKAA